MSEQIPKDRRQRIFHRVVGALVLTALAVILVPMLLDFRIDQETAITRSNIPERPEGMRIEEISLVPPVAPAVPPVAPVQTPPVQSSAPPADTPSATPPADAPPRAEAAAPAQPHAWVVRVGSFSSAENANALRDRLRTQGYPAFVDQVVVDGKTLSRVQVGPEAQRARGEQLRDRLLREMKLDAIVVAYE